MNLKPIFFLTTLVLCGVKSVSAQAWQKIYGSDYDHGWTIEPTFDGGYIIAGTSAANASADTGKVFLIRIDADGDTLWTKKYGAPYTAMGAQVKELPDSSLIVAYLRFGWDTIHNGIELAKFSYNGDIVWTRSTSIYDFPYAQIPNYYFFYHIPWNFTIASDGGIALVATGNDTAFNFNTEVLLFKFDPLGNPQWMKSFGQNQSNHVAGKIAVAQDGGYIISATKNYSTNSYAGEAWLIKTDISGNLQWEQTYNTPGSANMTNSLIPTADGGYVFGIYHWSLSGGSRILKVDSIGGVTWTCLLNQPGYTYWLYNGVSTMDGYAFTGYVSSQNHQGMLFLKLDLNGNIITERAFGGYTAWGHDIKRTDDGGYIIAGDENSFNLTNISKIYAVKIDSSDHSFSNRITGRIFTDNNGNCVKDVGEPPMPTQIVQVSGNYGPFYALTDSNGAYSLIVDTGAYFVSQAIQGYYNPLCPSTTNNGYSIHFIGYNAIIDSIDFANQVIPNVQDLEITTTINSFPSPGFSSNYQLTYRNTGTTIMSGMIRFSLDTNLTFLNATPPATSVIGNMYEWSFTNLSANETRNVTITFHCDSTKPLGTIVTSVGYIDPIVSDTIPVNNIDTSYATVIGSFDPNCKEVTPTGEGSQGLITSSDMLTYTIRFQNTGTDTAITVTLRDTIDTDLDLTTFKMLSASHTYTYQILGNGIIKWTFPNIMLPDSTTNEQESHGFVKFSILPRWTVPLGSQITNTAYIFFDYNQPVVTNTTLNTIGQLTGTDETGNNKQEIVLVYPNPFTDVLFIKNQSDGAINSCELYDQLGKLVKRISGEQVKYGINLSGISSGIYFLKVTVGNRNIFVKIVKN